MEQAIRVELGSALAMMSLLDPTGTNPRIGTMRGPHDRHCAYDRERHADELFHMECLLQDKRREDAIRNQSLQSAWATSEYHVLCLASKRRLTTVPSGATTLAGANP